MKAFETHVTGIKRTAVPEHLQQMKEFDEVYDLTAGSAASESGYCDRLSPGNTGNKKAF